MAALHHSLNESATPFGHCGLFYLGVSDEKQIRIKRLKAALDSKHVEPAGRARHLAEKCGKSVSYFSGLLAGDRSFGEKIARAIEGALDLPRAYLDQPGLSAEAMEVADLYDSLDTHGRRVLLATAHALMRPNAPGAEAIDAPPDPPKRTRRANLRTLAA